MRQPSLIRRILPWVFIAVFFLTAPILIYYTAGYRYNPKKGELERNGTLIVDSTPASALIFINGQFTDQKTPYTFQNIAPGTHTIRLTKDGYTPWIKNLEVKPERVTFANNIWLWRQNTPPQLIIQSPIKRISASPDRTRALLLFQRSNGTSLTFMTSATSLTREASAYDISSAFAPRWRDDGAAVLINGFSDFGKGYLVRADNNKTDITPLSLTQMHWDGRSLHGSDQNNSYQFDTRMLRLSQERLGKNTVDISGNVSIQRAEAFSHTIASTAGAYVFVDKSFLTKVYALPQGNWRIGGHKESATLLVDQHRWLAMDPEQDPPSYGDCPGDYPRWLHKTEPAKALLVNGTELWLMEMQTNATLLLRLNEPIIQAQWHRSGTSLFFATTNELRILSLDDRGGRSQHSLTVFDRIHDFDLIGKTILVAGIRQGVEGLWQMMIE